MTTATTHPVDEIVKGSVEAARADCAAFKKRAAADAADPNTAVKERRKLSKALVEKFVASHLSKHKEEVFQAVCAEAAKGIGWEVE